MSLNIQKIRVLCFDVDGTLKDTDDQMVAFITRLLKPINRLYSNFNPSSISRRFVMAMEDPGNALLHLSDRIGIDAAINHLDHWFNDSRFIRHRHHLLIHGVIETLSYLHQFYQMVIISARGNRITESFLEQHHLHDFFDLVVTSQTCRYTKPFPDQILFVADKLGTSPQSCVMIGDTKVDILAGVAAGAQTIGVLSGFGEEMELNKAGANLILPSVAEIPEILDVQTTIRKHTIV